MEDDEPFLLAYLEAPFNNKAIIDLHPQNNSLEIHKMFDNEWVLDLHK